ncbi:pyridoxamine 5'-phosphate oxidase family protein [Poseidonibacter lekithochrous]|uniref:pyridoxamine 5'-phosphate oxidase family protein n=1 Tax=Poseidonibacter TaxID=2321187 RepID=UPI001C0908A4|nr:MULTISPECIES: pyridoxamine 5'-phosphate oxidase family protein [Poseidonibacter]MBU3015074.1 pyridoxamine 5'-phosphate oxidase family protein [Poseidonibacter lekithochrous]MDO6828370.1 pyridoxamine 5'-phosphate oxidase family protein [Poseidonibacter sp. 1_MG-2023]
MNTIFHEGEYHIQEVMSVTKSADALSSMIKDTIPKIASYFLEDLNFCVLTLGTKNDNIFTSVVYDNKSFIKIISQNSFSINLKNKSHIPDIFFKQRLVNIGIIGLEFSSAKRIRINGKAKIINSEIIVLIDEIYSNCPKYIKKRFLQKQMKPLDTPIIENELELNQNLINVITNSDTFFLASGHKGKGLDVSYKGGEKGFVKVNSSTQLSFDDLPGNNLYNTLGNIYTNPYINMFFIDFENNNTYNILGNANIEEINIKEGKRLRVIINCIKITINKNSFSLDYK